MGETNITAALQRIGRSLDRLSGETARIEQIVARTARTNDRLRGEIQAAVAELDALLGDSDG